MRGSLWLVLREDSKGKDKPEGLRPIRCKQFVWTVLTVFLPFIIRTTNPLGVKYTSSCVRGATLQSDWWTGQWLHADAVQFMILSRGYAYRCCPWCWCKQICMAGSALKYWCSLWLWYIKQKFIFFCHIKVTMYNIDLLLNTQYTIWDEVEMFWLMRKILRRNNKNSLWWKYCISTMYSMDVVSRQTK